MPVIDLWSLLSPSDKAFAKSLLDAFLAGWMKPSENFDNAQIPPDILHFAQTRAAEIVTDLDQLTRDEVRAKVDSAIRNGTLDPSQLQESLMEMQFGQARARMIAETEEAWTFNVGQGMRDLDDGFEFTLIDDGIEDEMCAAVAGKIVRTADFVNRPMAHPYCTRVGTPMLPEQVKGREVVSFSPEEEARFASIHSRMGSGSFPSVSTTLGGPPTPMSSGDAWPVAI